MIGKIPFDILNTRKEYRIKFIKLFFGMFKKKKLNQSKKLFYQSLYYLLKSVEDELNIKNEFEIYMDNTVSNIQSEFLGMTIAGISIKSKHNYAIMIHLFLSMLPLHCDNERRQYAMLANVFRLYKELQLL
jgi:hypothetical protein